jgi:hypothetical protein
MLKNNPIKNIEHIARYSIAALFCLTIAASGKNNQSELEKKTLIYCS